MMTGLLLIASALAILPSDRMAMADRLFDRGSYADAKKEYIALKGSADIAEDELLFRLAECSRLLGDTASARVGFNELVKKFPMSRHVARSRLMGALAGTDQEKKSELKLLDNDSTPNEIRATALYHLGMLTNEMDFFSRCAKLDPKGPYAIYAKFQHACLASQSSDSAVRRVAIGDLMDIHFGKDPTLAREALYRAATQSYGDKRYGEAGSLFRRYLKVYPDDSQVAKVRSLAAWCDYLVGKYADAAMLCGAGETDDTAYLLAMCAYSMNDNEKAKKLMNDYLERFPNGAYRKAIELPLARMDFAVAEKSDDLMKAVEAAKRSALLSKSAIDRMRLAWAYEKASMPAEASTEYTAVARDFPSTDESAEALFRKAMIDLRAQNWSPAELALAEALKTGKNLSRKGEMLYWRGIAASRLGHDAKSVEFLKEAIATKSLSLDETREAKLILAEADWKSGRVAEAKSAYAKLVREGACDRMSASVLRSVGRFLLECPEGEKTINEAKICARALAIHADTPEWRQAAYALKGAAEEADGEFTVAIESYRAAMKEKVRSEETRDVSLSLGILESKAGNHGEADKTLKEAVHLNSSNPAARARAYLWLAKNAEAMTDYRGACAYATVLVTLFEGCDEVAEAKKILDAHPEEAK